MQPGENRTRSGTIYAVLTAARLIVLPCSVELRAYYLLYAARYFQGLVSVLMEHRRKDFLEMLLHHSVTLLLLGLSYVSGYTRVGAVVMLTLDPADVFLHFAKMSNYIGGRFQVGEPSRGIFGQRSNFCRPARTDLRRRFLCVLHALFLRDAIDHVPIHCLERMVRTVSLTWHRSHFVRFRCSSWPVWSHQQSCLPSGVSRRTRASFCSASCW